MANGLPDKFLPAEERHSLYEGIEYREFWKDPHLLRQDLLEQHIISRMLPVSGRRILDLGCGYGRLAPVYLDRFSQVVLCDGSVSLLRDAQTALGDRVVLVAADLGRLPFKAASFDSVLTIRVLHHMHDLSAALGEIRRVIGREGTLVFSYHNKRNAKWMVRYLAAQGDASPFSPEPTERIPTLISRHPNVFDAAMRGVGFSTPTYQGAVVVDFLAGITKRLGRRKPAGLDWAGITGRFRLAPWLIGRSLAAGGEAVCTADSIEDLLRCPMCRGSLNRVHCGFWCPICGRDYPVVKGLLDFRP